MVQELVEKYRQERAEAEGYEEALKGFYHLCRDLFTHSSRRRVAGPTMHWEVLETDLVVAGEKFNIQLQSSVLRWMTGETMAVVIKDQQGIIAPVFYLSRDLKTFALDKYKFSRHLEVCGISEGSLKEEDIWDLNCKLRPPNLDDIRRYQKVLEEMREALV